MSLSCNWTFLGNIESIAVQYFYEIIYFLFAGSRDIWFCRCYLTYLLLCGLGLPQECPKPLAVSRLRLPVRYPGLNVRPSCQLNLSILRLLCLFGRPKKNLQTGSSVSMRTTWPALPESLLVGSEKILETSIINS